MTPTTAKTNGRVAEGYAQASAGAGAGAHMQTHTPARTFNVYMCWGSSVTNRKQNASYEGITSVALVRIIAHKHALGYKLDYVFYNVDTGTYCVALAKRPFIQTASSYAERHGLKVGLIYECPIRQALVQTVYGGH